MSTGNTLSTGNTASTGNATVIRNATVSRSPAATALGAAAVLGLALTLTGCGSGAQGDGGSGDRSAQPAGKASAQSADPTRIPGVGDRLQSKIPEKSRQVVAVYGKGADSPDATVRLFTKHAGKWSRDSTWPAHNGRKGWTPDHRQDDKRSPVGVFTLTDAGGVDAAPKGTKLPYAHSSAFTPSPNWPKSTRNDFDHVIAVDYNRVRGTSPLDMNRPQGEEKGGSIWLHLDHGSGTSGCVSLPRAGVQHLLKTLDPKAHPVVVMGDKASLSR